MLFVTASVALSEAPGEDESLGEGEPPDEDESLGEVEPPDEDESLGEGEPPDEDVVMPETATGAERVVVIPSPSWPLLFLPRHFTLPSVSAAHECLPPRAMLVAVVMPKTSTGEHPSEEHPSVMVSWLLYKIGMVPSPSWS